MLILAIDSSGATAGAALINEDIVVGELNINADRTHSEILLPMVERLFALTNHSLADVDFVASTCGPGSFTGLRIGAATAKGLACGAEKPLIAVPTLDALAYNFQHTPHWIVPMMDARRIQVYAAFYLCERGRPLRYSGYMAVSVDDALASIVQTIESHATQGCDREIVFLGDGAAAHRERIIGYGLTYPYSFASSSCNRQRAASVGACALHMAAEGIYSDEGDFTLQYVRKPQAERERDKPPHTAP